MKNYGIEIYFPENVPFCEVALKNLILHSGEIKNRGTEHLELSVKNNNNNNSIRILELGIKIASAVFTYGRDVEIEPNNTFFKKIPYSAFIMQLEKSNIEDPYLLRGYAKLSTKEVFYSKEIAL